MKWGVRKSSSGSRIKKGSEEKSKKDTRSTLKSAVRVAIGIPKSGNPNAKLNSKSEKIAGDILKYSLTATTGASVGTSNHRRIGQDRTITKGEKIAEKHLDRVVRVGHFVGSLI